VLVSLRAHVKGNVVANNTVAGVTLRSSTNATLEANLVTRNRVGIADAAAGCGNGPNAACSSGVFVRNTVTFNAGTGIRVHGGGSFDSNVAHHNRVGIEVGSRARFEGDNASDNAFIGIRANGTIGMTHVVADRNGGHRGHGIVLIATGDCIIWPTRARNNSETGLVLVEVGATKCYIEGGNFSGNGKIGIDITGYYTTIVGAEISLNGEIGVLLQVRASVTIPRVTIPPVTLPTPPRQDEPDPLVMHRSNLVGNGQWALKVHPAAIARADQNFWGPAGPVYGTEEFHAGTNTVSPNAVTSPWSTDRTHTAFRLVPGAAAPQISP